MRITVPDGGIDASVDTGGIDVDKWIDSFIPEVRTSLQIKTGGSFKPWQKGDIKDELFGKKNDPSKANLGESVQSCLDAKGVYVVVCTEVVHQLDQPVNRAQLEQVFIELEAAVVRLV